MTNDVTNPVIFSSPFGPSFCIALIYYLISSQPLIFSTLKELELIPTVTDNAKNGFPKSSVSNVLESNYVIFL